MVEKLVKGFLLFDVDAFEMLFQEIQLVGGEHWLSFSKGAVRIKELPKTHSHGYIVDNAQGFEQRIKEQNGVG